MVAATMYAPKNFHDSIRNMWNGSGSTATSTTSMSYTQERVAASTTELLEEQRDANKEIIKLLTTQVKLLKKVGTGGDGIGLLELLGLKSLVKGGIGGAGLKGALRGVGLTIGAFAKRSVSTFKTVASFGMTLLRPLEGLKNVISTSGLWKTFTTAAATITKPGLLKGILGKLALPLTALMGVVDAFSGWSNADKILGKDASKLTLTDKISAAFGNMWNSVFLGIPDMIVQYFGGRNLASFGATIHDYVKTSFMMVAKRIPGVRTLVDRIEKAGGIKNLIWDVFDKVRVALWDGIKYIGTAMKDMIVDTMKGIRSNFREWLTGGGPGFFSDAAKRDVARNAGAAIGAMPGPVGGSTGSATSTSSGGTSPSGGFWNTISNLWNGDSSAPQVEASVSAAAASDYSKVVEAGAGFTTVTDSNGRVVRREGARNWRNNNPGNIEAGEYANSLGAVGSDGRFAVFPSYEAGRKAKEKLFFESKNYKDKTLFDAVSRYAPPSENNTMGYAQAIAAATGTSLNTPVSSFTPEQRVQALDAMQKVEGYKVGKETVLNPGRTPTMPIADGHAGTAGRGNWEGVDPRLKHLYDETSKEFPLRNRMMSGQKGRGGGAHADGKAFDITLYDQAGNPLPSYQEGTAFRAYELFAQTMHKKAQELYPDLVSGKGGEMLDWGGLFGDDGRGRYKYGSNDLMDFRITRGDKTRAGNIMEGLQGHYKGWYDKNDALGGSKPYSEAAYNSDMLSLHNFTLSDQQKANASYFGVARNSPFLGKNKAVTPTTADLGAQRKAASVNLESPLLGGKQKIVSPAFDQALDSSKLRSTVPSYESLLPQQSGQQRNMGLGSNTPRDDGSFKVSEIPSMDEMKMLLINGSSIT